MQRKSFGEEGERVLGLSHHLDTCTVVEYGQGFEYAHKVIPQANLALLSLAGKFRNGLCG